MIDSVGIIAAGEGNRLKLAGIDVHKPLVSVAGVPLIGHTLRHFADSGVRRGVIIFNEAEQECADWVRRSFPELELEILIKSTRSSFESFWLVGRALGPGRHLICTVDSICSSADWRKMIASEARSAREILLGVTCFVHDEKPLWVGTEPGSLKITEIGGPGGTYATAGFYNVSDAIFEREWKGDLTSLRVFLGEILREGFPGSVVPLAEVIDVDTVEDINLAERFISQIRSGV